MGDLRGASDRRHRRGLWSGGAVVAGGRGLGGVGRRHPLSCWCWCCCWCSWASLALRFQVLGGGFGERGRAELGGGMRRTARPGWAPQPHRICTSPTPSGVEPELAAPATPSSTTKRQQSSASRPTDRRRSSFDLTGLTTRAGSLRLGTPAHANRHLHAGDARGGHADAARARRGGTRGVPRTPPTTTTTTRWRRPTSATMGRSARVHSGSGSRRHRTGEGMVCGAPAAGSVETPCFATSS